MISQTTSLDHVLDISKQLSLADQLSLIGLLSERVRQELDRDGEPVDMLSLAGLGADLWQEIDVDAYLEQERASWEN
ncbi:MAG: hypothetical protein JXA14_25780 [Anaerolineae bacterium]|nr:hypothetical protein [Anaerolineae bacterium]